jgi:ring-1,2-phenylacetyl-CoA epoxidase subunit PaaD
MVNAEAAAAVDEQQVRSALQDVTDPEIPVISIVDLGIVHGVRVEGGRINVDILPTFIGCPALEVIRSAVAERLAAFGLPVEVRISHAVPWSSDRISPAGRQALERAGFAPPARIGPEPALIELGRAVRCPHCGSGRTVLENAFGPTQCRAIHHCTACRQPFEAFKPV